MQSGKSRRAEIATAKVHAIPGLKIETWGTQSRWEREMRMGFLIARSKNLNFAKRKCTPRGREP
jgi:hypothetical protein